MAIITSASPTVDMPDVGVSLSIQHPPTEGVTMVVHPCLAGTLSYHLVTQQLAQSTAYNIGVDKILQTTVSVQHCAIWKSKEACINMTFLLARTEESSPVYTFTEIAGTAGLFKRGSTTGKIVLGEFGLLVVATAVNQGIH